MFYALPKELVIKRKDYLELPRNPYDILYTDKYDYLINDDVFLQLIWESYAWSVWQFIQVPRRDGYGNIPGKWTDYSGDFPLWRLCFVIQNYFRKKFEYEMEWSFQKLYMMPKEMQIPWLTYQQFSNLIGNLTDMIVAEQNWQPMIDEIWKNRQMEDYSERKSTYKRDFINKWYCSWDKKKSPIFLDEAIKSGEEISEELKAILSKEALIEKRKVRLASNDKINKMLVSSTGKLGSINKIVASEYANLGDSLRMLILTDYIKKDMLKLVGTDEEIHALGTVPVFESIRRTAPDAKVAVLSGTLVILPDSAVETAQEIAYNEGVPCRIKKLENTNHTEIIFSGSNKNKVSIITKAFQLGVINVLIGTKSLLGEGWDSPNINSLILASFVGSFMLSNQMRGRAIRIDKKNPEKVSNIWHLVTVEPDSKDEIISDDFETMKRRFACFQAPAYNSDVIESGTDRIDILKAPYDANGLESINNQMLSLAAARNVMSGRWNGAVKGKARPEVEEVSEIPAEVQPASAVHKNKIYAIVLAVLIVLAIIIIATSGFFGGLLGFIIAAVCGVLLIKSASVVMKNSSPEKTVSNISNAILRTLKEIGEIESRGATVSVKKSEKKNTVNCSLSKATVREKNVFAKAVSELLSPIDDPRYLLIGTKGISKLTSRNYVQSYACPSVIAVNKETAEILAKNLKSAGGKFELVFTRNENGRKELFKCRKYSYINANSKLVKNKKIVK